MPSGGLSNEDTRVWGTLYTVRRNACWYWYMMCEACDVADLKGKQFSFEFVGMSFWCQFWVNSYIARDGVEPFEYERG